MNKNVQKAMKQHQRAAESLIESVKVAYPVGAVVTVEIGRSTFDAEITDHRDFWWSSPGEMSGRNLSTGKVRRFSAHAIKD